MKNFCYFVITLKNALKVRKKYIVIKNSNKLILQFVCKLYGQGLIHMYLVDRHSENLVVIFNNSSYEELTNIKLVSKPSKKIYFKRKNIKWPLLNYVVLSTSTGLTINNNSLVNNGGLALVYF